MIGVVTRALWRPGAPHKNIRLAEHMSRLSKAGDIELLLLHTGQFALTHRPPTLLQKTPLHLPNWGDGVDISGGVDKKLGRYWGDGFLGVDISNCWGLI